MTGFSYQNGVLSAENVPLTKIAESVGTPVYVYSDRLLRDNYTTYATALKDSCPQNKISVCFSVKANSNIAVLKTLESCGAGADVVSGGELLRARKAGIAPNKIVFSGVGKTREELQMALTHDIYQVNVESEPELLRLSALAAEMNKTISIAIRVNPDVDAKTHEKITTGKKENKFGIDIDQALAFFQKAASLPCIKPVSVAVHIGSQLTDVAPFQAAFKRVATLIETLRAQGIKITRVDLGGGLGISYHKDESPISLTDYAAAIRAVIAPLGCEIISEPGRFIAGSAGLLLSRVIQVKKGQARSFLIIDAGMNDLVRSSFYGAYHDIVPVQKGTQDAVPYDVVGPICESGDTFAKKRLLPPLKDDDLLALMTAGAYGAVMSSTYNTRPLVPEVLVKGDQYATIRHRPSFEEMVQGEGLPGWL